MIYVVMTVRGASGPWGDGRCERHGGIAKEAVAKALALVDVESPEELAELMDASVSAKNRFYNRGGYAPYQLVFGRLPRLPQALLADDANDEAGLQDLLADRHEASAAAAFRSAHQIREDGAAAMASLSATKWFKDAMNARTRVRHDVVLFIRQWVFVWQTRRGRAGVESVHDGKARWVGPGTVLMASGGSVFVMVGVKLWKASPAQVRHAARGEAAGAELLIRSGACDELRRALPMRGPRGVQHVDIIGEGAPAEDDPGVGGLLPLREAGPEAEGRENADQELPAETADRESSQDIEEDSVEDSTAGQIDSVDVEPPSEIRKVVESAAGCGSGDEAAADKIPEPEAKRERTDEQDYDDPEQDPEEQEEQTVSIVRPGDAIEVVEEQYPPVVRRIEDYERDHRARPYSIGLTEAEETDVKINVALFKCDQFGDDRGGHCATSLAPRMTTEVNIKRLPPSEQKLFETADRSEWANIVRLGAVRAHRGAEAQARRMQWPDRIRGSRLVRRKKASGANNIGWIAKSRWCLLGQQDPDMAEFDHSSYAPTPGNDTIRICIQVLASLQVSLVILDAKNAFCQGRELKRRRGPVFASPCDGIGLEPGDLIELVCAVYGRVDAPTEWRRSLCEALFEIGFPGGMVEPCLWLLRGGEVDGDGTNLVGLVLVDVDDVVLGGRGAVWEKAYAMLLARFEWGRAQHGEGTFIGRYVKTDDSFNIRVSQKTYVESIPTVKIPLGWASNHKKKLEVKQIAEMREVNGKVLYAARETRPDGAATA
ncbi:hypothetical protein N9L19_01045 [bacterium]|nr:hypothetical protein [bacterium]